MRARELVVVGLSTLMVTGCGGGDRKLSSPQEKVRAAVEATIDKGTFLATYKAEATLEELVNAKRRESLLSGNVGGVDLQMALGDDEVVYVRGSAFGGALDGIGGRWLRHPRGDIDTAIDQAALPSIVKASFTRNLSLSLLLLAALRNGQGTSMLGRDVIGGRATTHYVATVSPPEFRGDLALEAWVSDAGLVVQMKTLSESEGETQELIIGIGDHGIDVPELPAADQAVSISELKRQQAGDDREGRAAGTDEAGNESSELATENALEIRFDTPSDDIGCLVTDDWAECDIRDNTFKPPPRPEDCPVDWGSSLTVSAEGATFVCKGDTVRSPDAPTLAYGDSVRTASIECFSRKDGVTCTHRPTGRGFQLAKARYRLF